MLKISIPLLLNLFATLSFIFFIYSNKLIMILIIENKVTFLRQDLFLIFKLLIQATYELYRFCLNILFFINIIALLILI